MQSSYALFKDGVYVNTIEADTYFINSITNQYDKVIDLNNLPLAERPTFGWQCVNDQLIPPTITEVPVLENINQVKKITIPSFKKRFGIDAGNILTSEHKVCRAAKEMLYDAPYVDLEDPLVTQLLDSLILTEQPSPDPMFPGSGPMTEEKKLAILNNPILDNERYN